MAEIKRAMESIVGNLALKQRLCRDIRANSLSHAYILEGAEGSGRSTIALLCAAATACEKRSDTNAPLPCLECPSCKKILEGKSPDVIFVNSGGKATLGVDAARFIKEDVYITPNDLDNKFYIVEDADKMTVQAQNAILLTLEEPPAFVHFFLLCQNSSSLLETIRSRAPTLRTEPLSDSDVDNYIYSHDRRADELKQHSSTDYTELLRAADGSIGKALAMLDQKSLSTLREQREFTRNFVRTALRGRGAREVLPLLSAFSSKRDIFAEQLSLISSALRDLILLKNCDTPPLSFYSSPEDAIELCDSVSATHLLALQSAVFEAMEENKRNANIRLVCMKLALSADII